MGSKKMGGYFTVEAAFITPIVICVVALLCYLGLFMCNRCMLLQDAYLLCVKGSTTEGSNAEIASYILKQGNGMHSKYYGISQIDKKVDVSIHEISVELQSKMKVPFAFFAWEEKKMSGVWNMQIKKTIDRIDPVDFIRAYRKAEKLLN